MQSQSSSSTATTPATNGPLMLVLAWVFVGIPLVWGISLTLVNVAKLFA